ncbi:MAG: ribosomal protein S18-alanine N-acetyltransferase [Methanobacteriaceae archaeon]|jgi:ribosomal-protein-alanine N-acetyltransferase|nr:ribosomal protein S18-alanine N-acetyltransferase [Candidatus Methanorudis spinitermitis]
MIIREFRPKDLRRVHEIEKMSFSNPYEIEMLKQLFDIGTGFLVAHINDYIVGYIIFWIKKEDQGHIISLAVDNNYKRQNIGSKLIMTAIDIFKNFDIKRISLEVKAQNKEAVYFYKSIGFFCDEKILNYYEEGVNAFRMSFICVDEF